MLEVGGVELYIMYWELQEQREEFKRTINALVAAYASGALSEEDLERELSELEKRGYKKEYVRALVKLYASISP